MSDILTKALLFFAVASAMGWVLLIAGIHTGRKKKQRKLWEDTRTPGTIAEYVSTTVSTGRRGKSTYWYPVVAFEAGGKQYRVQYGGPVNRNDFPVGKEVTVLYEVNNPEHFHMEEDVNFYKGSASVARLGLIWILASVVVTYLLAVFVGGADPNPVNLFRAARPTATPATFSGNQVYQYWAEGKYSAVITGYSGNEESLTIPWTVDGRLVSGFTANAFSRNTRVRKITVPGQISAVPAGAFSGCMGLKELTLKEGVKKIGMMAVGMNPVLELVTLPKSLTDIADSAFPDDCGAVFRVVEGSAAEAYCKEKGFKTQPAE